jgi:hypothetical protein
MEGKVAGRNISQIREKSSTKLKGFLKGLTASGGNCVLPSIPQFTAIQVGGNKVCQNWHLQILRLVRLPIPPLSHVAD